MLFLRLLLLVQATAKFADTHLGSGKVSTFSEADAKKVAGSVGLVVKQFWTQISSLQTLYQQLQSEVGFIFFFLCGKIQMYPSKFKNYKKRNFIK